MSTNSFYLNIAAITFSVSCFVVYYFYFFYRTRWSKDYSVQINKNVSSVKTWVKRHLKNHEAASVTLSVQTLRNTQYVAIFVGGYAIKLSYAFIDSIHSSEFTGYSDVIYLKDVRSLIVSVLLFCSFLNWAAVLRYACEIAYLIDSFTEASRLETFDDNEDVTNKSSRSYNIADMSVRLTFHFSFGLRFMYASIPFAFLIVGPIALIIATVIVIAYQIDHDYGSYTVKNRAPLV